METTRKILALSAFAADRTAALAPPIRDLVARRSRAFGEGAVLFYDEPLHLTRGQGTWLYDDDGTPYLDAYNNVPSVGHCHPQVVAAIARQAALLNTHTRYITDIVLDYAERLLATFPATLANLALTCTGSESVDLALRVARGFTGASGIVVTRNAYHGNTTAASQISPSSGAAVPIGVDVRTVMEPDPRRHPPDALGRAFAADLRDAIDDLRRHGIGFAALVIDSIFSSDGIFPDPPGFLQDAVEVAHAAGGLFIADEVQPGFCRTGDAMWGFMRHNVVPDMVVLGKPMGNGVPLAGVVARPEVIGDFTREAGYFNTFGGTPMAAAAGLAVLEVLKGEGLLAQAAATGAYLRAGLERLRERHPSIAEVRGAGLYVGVELEAPGGGNSADHASRVVNEMRRRRVLIGTAGRHGNVLKIRPPLCFARAEADILLATLDAVLGSSLQPQP